MKCKLIADACVSTSNMIVDFHRSFGLNKLDNTHVVMRVCA